MKYQHISSKDNILIKKVVRLLNNKKFRQESKLAVIYGWHLIEEAYKYNLLQSVLFDESLLLNYIDTKDDKHGSNIDVNVTNKLMFDDGVEKFSVSKLVMDKINILDSYCGVIGIIQILDATYETIDQDSAEIFDSDCIILDNIQDPGNLGTILRTAKAVGFNQIVISANSVDVYNPKVLRASQGLQFGMRIISNVDMMDFITKYHGLVVLTTPHTDVTIYNLDLKQKVALVFGNEGSGLGSALLNMDILSLERCAKAKIPMVKSAESLNIAIAAGVCMFEVLRQRL